MTTPVNSPFSRNSGRAVFWGGLLAGTFDLAFALIFYGAKLGVVQAIAAGLVGRSAFQGGWPMALLGVLLHYLIAFIWAGIFQISSRQLPWLIRHAVPVGLGYGLVIFYGMNSVVLPLSALQTKAWPPSLAPWPIAVHVLLVGLPIALAAKRFSRTTKAT